MLKLKRAGWTSFNARGEGTFDEMMAKLKKIDVPASSAPKEDSNLDLVPDGSLVLKFSEHRLKESVLAHAYLMSFIDAGDPLRAFTWLSDVSHKTNKLTELSKRKLGSLLKNVIVVVGSRELRHRVARELGKHVAVYTARVERRSTRRSQEILLKTEVDDL